MQLRFSLRRLFLVVTLIAIVLSVWVAYRRATLCQLRWLSPNSKEAASLFPKAAPEKLGDGSYRLTYYARNVDVQSLVRNAREPTIRAGSFNMLVDRQAIAMESDNLQYLQQYLQAMQAADVRVPKSFLIRGRVVDRKGKPVPGATIDLMGDYVFINHFETRDDGTFTMPLVDGAGGGPQAGGRYYLRIRLREETAANPVRWNTPTFSLDVNQPERDVIIAIPQVVDE